MMRDIDLTPAVEAAARAQYDAEIAARREVFPPGVKFKTFDELGAPEKLAWRQYVLPLVQAAIEAIPDPRRTAWLEGYEAADNGRNEDTNPYPQEEL